MATFTSTRSKLKGLTDQQHFVALKNLKGLHRELSTCSSTPLVQVGPVDGKQLPSKSARKMSNFSELVAKEYIKYEVRKDFR